MSIHETLQRVAQPLGDAVHLGQGESVRISDRTTLAGRMEGLARTAALAGEPEAILARWLIRAVAAEVGVFPASIDPLYRARGRGKTRNDFTVPAMNLRALAFHSARAVFRAARSTDAKAIVFEIARSEMGYTAQKPSEYASSVLAAAVAEGHRGPVFIQGDHFQVGAKRFADNAEKEVEALRSLIGEAIDAGFFNIDIDSSTLVDLTPATLEEQQQLNVILCAELSQEVRRREPRGLTISIGGEIGEVGGRNSTEAELRAFMDGFNRTFGRLRPGAPGLSKISIQTGTSHGGVVLPDGSIADVKVDFETLGRLSETARRSYGLAGAVQHGASTLPEEAFARFAEAGACEVHLATNFQNMLFERLPDGLRKEMYAFLDSKFAGERKPGMTDEQFYYKVRKNAIGPFKKPLWEMSGEVLDTVGGAWETQFRLLFERLGVSGTRTEVERYVTGPVVRPSLATYLKGTGLEADVGDLAD
ncbi:MAG TPA: class II fructose-bisphosphate aldolase [Anaerolineales bacterium]|nr:class II fructose-bisphosphate aldolase [Anaerolineales bacterium]